MPRSAGDAAPREYLARGQWPDGDLRGDAPVSAVYGQAFSVRLRAALAERGNPSLREVEREAGVSRRTVERTLKGEVLPDFGAMARLESWLGAGLWPGTELRGEQGAGEGIEGCVDLVHASDAHRRPPLGVQECWCCLD